jgi:hypothetical protein
MPIILQSITTSTPIQENNILCERNITEKLTEIAENVSLNHTFVPIIYDCSQYSRDIVLQLRSKNISAFCIYGYYKANNISTSHTWVEVKIDNQIIPIEATSGQIIDNYTYSKHYIVRSRGICL